MPTYREQFSSAFEFCWPINSLLETLLFKVCGVKRLLYEWYIHRVRRLLYEGNSHGLCLRSFVCSRQEILWVEAGFVWTLEAELECRIFFTL